MTDLKNWEEFEQKYQQFVVWHEKLQHDHQPLRVSNLLFRGQASAGWPLKTTLERYTQDATWTLPDYFRRMHTTKAAVETYTDKCWDIPAPHFYDLWLKEKGNSPAGLPPPPGYDYMVYLRHHNFPSPLLDWSRSSYIAAFFAFMQASPNENGRVAIYVFLEWQGEFNPGGPC